jgi:ribokinase
MSGATDPAVAAERLLDLGPGAVVVTLGGDGLVAATAEGGRLTLPARKVQVVSTHGAGDAFTGALAAELVRGAELGQALSFAQGAAALTVSTHPDARANISAGTVRSFLVGSEAQSVEL